MYQSLLARLMGQYWFARWRLSSSVTMHAGGWAGHRARGRSGGRHCTAGQYGYVPLGDTLFHEQINDLQIVSLLGFLEICTRSNIWTQLFVTSVLNYQVKTSCDKICRLQSQSLLTFGQKLKQYLFEPWAHLGNFLKSRYTNVLIIIIIIIIRECP